MQEYKILIHNQKPFKEVMNYCKIKMIIYKVKIEIQKENLMNFVYKLIQDYLKLKPQKDNYNKLIKIRMINNKL